MFDAHRVAMIVAMTLMYRYHVGSSCGSDQDPLRPLLHVYKVNAKSVAKQIKQEVGENVGSIQAALKKRKAKQAAATKTAK